MTEFVTIYRKDFLWPPLRPYFPRTDLSCTIAVPTTESTPTAAKPKLKPCGCTFEGENEDPDCCKCSPSSPPPKPILKACGCVDRGDDEEPDCCGKKALPPGIKECGCVDRPDDEEQDCCREYKSDVKPIPVPCPKTMEIEFAETDTCLKKLLEANPNLISVMKKLPTTDAIKKFNLERLKSTYMVDFDRMVDPPGGDFAELPPKPPCPLDDPIPPKIDCRVSRSRRELIQTRGITERGKRGKFPCEKKAIPKRPSPLDEYQQPAFLLKSLPPWSTEYRDQVGKNGAEIMKQMALTGKRRTVMKRRKEMLELANPDCPDQMMLG